MQLTLAHTPDPDDAFMFYALVTGRVRTGGYKFQHIVKDIHSLNQSALEQKWDITAISFALYPKIAHAYQLLACGASVGDGYGPVVVSRDKLDLKDLARCRVATPGLTTTSHLVFLLLLKDIAPDAVPMVVEAKFTEIPGLVLRGTVQAGILIHEWQLTYGEKGLRLLVDLGLWWKEKFHLPLPLGANVVRRSLPDSVKRDVASILEEAIRFAIDNPEQALDYAMQFARGLPREQTSKFINLYVNRRTISLDEQSLEALRILLSPMAELRQFPIDPLYTH